MNDQTAPAFGAPSADSLIQAARDADSRQDWATSLASWAAARRMAPDDIRTWHGHSDALARLGLFEAQEQLLSEARDAFAHDFSVAVAWGLVAHYRHRLDDALLRWRVVAAQWPMAIEPPCYTVAALRQLGRLEEADAALLLAEEAFPGNPYLATERAHNLAGDRLAPMEAAAKAADAAQDWPAACDRWEAVIALRPDLAHPWLAKADALRHLGLFDAHDSVLTAARAAVPQDFNIAVGWAVAAHYRHDLIEALHRWSRVKAGWPDAIEVVCYSAAALRGLNRIDAATDVVAEAAGRFPDNRFLAAEQARNDDHRGAWAQSILVWQDLASRYPEDETYREALGHARLRLDYDRVDSEAPASSPDERGIPDGSEREFVLQFESLGCDCEFGLFQRRCGAEPLGLFRWASTGSVQQIARALEDRLSRLGSVETTQLKLIEQEFYVRDDASGVGMHTFINVHEVPDQDRLLANMRKRLVFLRRQFLEQIAVGQKILVFKDRQGADLDAIAALHDVLQSHGPNRLLVVQAAPAPQNGPALRAVRPGLLIGSMERFGNPPAEGLPWSVPADDWLALCRAAAAHPAFARAG